MIPFPDADEDVMQLAVLQHLADSGGVDALSLSKLIWPGETKNRRLMKIKVSPRFTPGGTYLQDFNSECFPCHCHSQPAAVHCTTNAHVSGKE